MSLTACMRSLHLVIASLCLETSISNILWVHFNRAHLEFKSTKWWKTYKLIFLAWHYWVKEPLAFLEMEKPQWVASVNFLAGLGARLGPERSNKQKMCVQKYLDIKLIFGSGWKVAILEAESMSQIHTVKQLINFWYSVHGGIVQFWRQLSYGLQKFP